MDITGPSGHTSVIGESVLKVAARIGNNVRMCVVKLFIRHAGRGNSTLSPNLCLRRIVWLVDVPESEITPRFTFA